jgi:putative flippase GtrA
MAVGTLAGLAVKYAFDKKHIFSFPSRSLIHDGQKFILYCLMGVVTTCVFWAIEMAFDYIFHTFSMRYVGAVTGLSIGYFVKYQLDKRYVFVEYA